MSRVFNGMGGPRWGGFCEPHAWFPTRVGGPLGCGLCEPHVWVFQLAWVGRSGAGLGTCWRGSLVQFSLYRVPRGCGLREQSDVPNSHGSAVWRRGECLLSHHTGCQLVPLGAIWCHFCHWRLKHTQNPPMVDQNAQGTCQEHTSTCLG